MEFCIRVSNVVPAVCAALLALSLSGCSGGGGSGSGGPPPDPVSIATTSLPNGQVGQPYSATLEAAGGKTPYTWSLASGIAPSGLSLDATGVLAGHPSTPATAVALNLKVTDSSTPPQASTAMLPITIAPATLAIGARSLPNGQVGVVYSVPFSAAGGTPPYTWSPVTGSLPAGLTFDTATAILAGTPTAIAQAAAVSFKVTDSGQPAQTATAPLTITIAAAAPITIATTSLPCGQVAMAYSASLLANGGTTPYTWSLTSGSLDGLTLSSAGAITGAPTATAAATPVTFQVTDSGSPAQTANVAVTLTVGAGGTGVCIVPSQAALTVTQTLSVSATTNDTSGVAWSMSPAGGSINPATSLSAGTVVVTAPSTAGVYTLTATSVNSGVQASITIGVTDLPAVATWHNDLARDGVNAQEYALTSSNVSTATFGKLFSCPVDGAVYAQPLWVANLMVNGAQHNAVIVATQHDSVYAFDADASPCQQLWHANLIDAAHGGGGAGIETPVPSASSCAGGGGSSCYYIGQGGLDIEPEVGVTGTPVIDPQSVTDATGTVYVVSKSLVNTGSPATSTFYQRLHALDLTTGNELTNAPETIALSYPGTAQGGSSVTFSARQENQRTALALVNGTVYIAWGSHEDTAPYSGWLAGYTYSSQGFALSRVYNVTPNAGNGGIWMSGAAPAADDNGNLYVVTGNGQFDVSNTTGPTNDYGDSFLQLTPNSSVFTVSSYFTPSDQQCDFIKDRDAGSGGAAVVLNLGAGSPAPEHMVVGGGKDGTVFVLDGDSMGGYVAPPQGSCSATTNARQAIQLPVGGIFATGAFWNETYYLGPAGTTVLALPFNTASLTFGTQALTAAAGTQYRTSATFAWPGMTPSISASGGSTNGIVWTLDSSQYCTPQSRGCGPAVLHAFDAAFLGTELWNSSMVTGDAAGDAVKFTVPTVANGKVYVGTRGNNTGAPDGAPGAIDGELDVYGLKPY